MSPACQGTGRKCRHSVRARAGGDPETGSALQPLVGYPLRIGDMNHQAAAGTAIRAPVRANPLGARAGPALGVRQTASWGFSTSPFMLAMDDVTSAVHPGSGFGGAPRVLDLDHLTTPILSAIRANVMRALQLTAGPAWDKVDHWNEVMTATVALMRPADPLFGKCAHDDVLLLRRSRAVSSLTGQVNSMVLSCPDGYPCSAPSAASSSSESRSASCAKRSSGWSSGCVDRSSGPWQSDPQLGCIGMASRIH